MLKATVTQLSEQLILGFSRVEPCDDGRITFVGLGALLRLKMPIPYFLRPFEVER
jgi:hypothetical protein